MNGLYFKHGTMNSSKSANMLMIKHNYEEQGFKVILLKPSVDTRENTAVVRSRVGIESPCVMIDTDSDLISITADCDVIMVDEAQFCTKEQIETLYEISFDKVVMGFGLLTDFKRELFEGSKRLLELADSVQEIKSICKCGRRAVVNGRFENGELVTSGKTILIGGNETYKALCKNCYHDLIKK